MMPPGMMGVPGLGMDRAELKSRILTQLEYYFSTENLIKDVYLRNQMEEDGWVSLELICGFKRLKTLLLCTNDPGVLFQAIEESSNLEVDEARQKMRRRDAFRGDMTPA